MDFRPDNFMFGTTPEAPPLAIVDWQTVTHGPAMSDLAYLFGGCFEPSYRAEVERDLLDDYAVRMAAAGVVYERDAMWQDYRLSSLWGVVMTVIATIMAAQTERGDAMLTVMGQRHGRHALDLEALDLLR
jgi:aminoglycoside phosphotransferase (APT) family kinase protein